MARADSLRRHETGAASIRKCIVRQGEPVRDEVAHTGAGVPFVKAGAIISAEFFGHLASAHIWRIADDDVCAGPIGEQGITAPD